MTEKQQKTRDALNKMILAGAAAGGGALAYSPNASAITIADINTGITSIVANTDAAADVAWPIGASIMALTIISYVFQKFIMG